MAKYKREPGTIKCFNCRKKHRYQPNGDYCVVPDKPKLRRVKAWAIVFDDGTPMEAHTNRYADRLVGMKITPCTILIDEKYLRGKK